MNRRFLFSLVALIVAAVGCSVVVYHRERVEHSRLAAQLTAIRLQVDAAERRRAENTRMAELIELNRRDRRQAASALRTDLENARREVTELEHTAVEQHDKMTAAARAQLEALQNNRDLTQGPMLIENCANVGRATPEAALQTLVWASAHGHDDVVRSTLAFDGAARTLAEAALAVLPESSRSKYPNPESLGALFVAQVVNDLSGLRVAERTLNGTEATLKLAGLQKQLGDVALKQGPDGWQVVIDSTAFEKIRRLLLTPKK